MTLKFDDYDTRHYPTVDVKTGYAEWSKTYDAKMATVMDIDLLERLELDWSSLASAVDLACGTGRIGAWMRERGVATIDGVDLTAEMLEHAKTRGVYQKLSCADIRHSGLEPGYDLVMCSLAAEHLADISELYAEAARLAPSGLFVIIAYHPAFLLRGIPTHFRNTDGDNIAITSHIHLFSDHVAGAKRHGWQLTGLEERVVDADLLSKQPSWQRHKGWPASFLAAFVRA